MTNKNDLKEDKPKQKVYWDVKIETLLPATLTYKVLAESAEEASKLVKHKQPNAVKYKLIGRRDIKIAVYKAGTSIMSFIKNLLR